jgi:putative peptide zinc metalloprotease protein
VRIGDCPEGTQWSREITGTATLGAARRSFAWRALKWLLAVFQRESGA